MASRLHAPCEVLAGWAPVAQCLGGNVTRNDNAVRPGAGRVRLRPNRGFQRCLVYEVNPRNRSCLLSVLVVGNAPVWILGVRQRPLDALGVDSTGRGSAPVLVSRTPTQSSTLLPCKNPSQHLSIPSALAPQRGYRKAKMKRLTSLAIVIFTSLGIAAFGGQPVTSSAPAVSRPSGFFRANEFETGAFGTFATGIGSRANSDSHAWGGGLDVTHWLPWKYGGIRFQGTGTNTR
jgi:hypothetical protein